MKKIRKLTAIQPVSFLPEGREAVKEYCEEAIFYDTEPQDDREIIERIGDSDAVFVSYNRTIGENILSACQIWSISECAAACTRRRALM